MKVRFIFCLLTVLQQLPFYNNYYLAPNVICKFERRSTIICRPFVASTYHLQQCYLLYKPQISGLPSC